MDKPAIIRRHYTFSGYVQGVGFRYRANHGAAMLGLTGWVKNEWDGTVTMEVQGPPAAITKLITLINQGTYVEITDMRVREIPLVPHEIGFHVR